jgi:hypothetical protein
MAGYGRVLQALGETNHRGCLVLTSREAPPELSTLSGETGSIRALALDGLSLAEGQALLGHSKLSGDESAWGTWSRPTPEIVSR